MPNELNPNDPRNLWQSQEGEDVTITLEEIRLRAARFERRIRRRNLREYVEQGGFIFAEACGGNAEFDQGFRLLHECRSREIFRIEQGNWRRLQHHRSDLRAHADKLKRLQ